MLNLVLFGPPGAGKGTQSEKLISHYQLEHISTGDILRAERKSGTDLGKQADQYISEGKLVPDAVVIGMVRNVIASKPAARGFIFDGFPRTIAQGEALDEMLKEFNTSITVMVALDVVEEELVKRLLNRGLTSGRADDQDEGVIRKRFQVYMDETMPLLDYYAKQGKARKVHGIGEIDEIFAALVQEIDNASGLKTV